MPGIFFFLKDWWDVLYLKQWCLMQCSTLHYITLRTALLRYSFKKKSVSRHAVSQQKVPAQATLDIFQIIIRCPVQFSYGQSRSGTRVCCHCKFTLPEASLASSLARAFYTSLSFSHPCIFPSCLLQKAFALRLFLITGAALCSRLLYHPCSWNFDWGRN